VATLSVRQIAQNRLGAMGDIFVNSQVYAYVLHGADGSVLRGLIPVLSALH
jgi:hypothetical protein